MIKLLSVILVKTFNKSRFLKFLAARMKSTQKGVSFTLLTSSLMDLTETDAWSNILA